MATDLLFVGHIQLIRCSCLEYYKSLTVFDQHRLSLVAFQVALLGEAHWLKLPPRPGTIVTICMSCFTTGRPAKEHGTNKHPPTGRVQERSKGDITCLTTSQNPSLWHPSWLIKVCTTRKDSESEWLAKDNPETNPITIKPKTASHVTELFSWVPLAYCSPPGCPFPIKSLAWSAHVSPWTIHFRVLDKSPVSGPGRGPPSSNSISGKESACQCRRRKRCRFNSWFRKIPWRRKWQSILVFLPGESQWQKPGRLHSIRLQRMGHN